MRAAAAAAARGRRGRLGALLALAVLAHAAGAAASRLDVLGAVVVERHHGRRLSGWIGGGVGSMIAANDAVGAIESAVDDDNFGSTYAATQAGYEDADMAVYPETREWLLSGISPGYNGYYSGGPGPAGNTPEEDQVSSEVNGWGD
ncbi:hypothetical protein Rsub_08487 [Raphidocelis subcapitata]|uniref:Uncharacterized protein n=1 Tax=Raphidocelis subcapitata TaxID=307507 RepID=A0A2V0P7T2_9CHLO|nr:hypothetical protein Rsub_08487 [Raphidocelis subcapitata]|eukprot:GBF95896.1 hypothetical protein Rsub_08487 [Raphidocelis subcapitata]